MQHFVRKRQRRAAGPARGASPRSIEAPDQAPSAWWPWPCCKIVAPAKLTRYLTASGAKPMSKNAIPNALRNCVIGAGAALFTCGAGWAGCAATDGTMGVVDMGGATPTDLGSAAVL